MKFKLKENLIHFSSAIDLEINPDSLIFIDVDGTTIKLSKREIKTLKDIINKNY